MIELLKVNKVYHTNTDDVTALKNVSMKLYDDQLTFIVGGSGSGKSTLLNCISGLDSIDSGTIFFNETEKMNNNNYKYIGLVFQEHHLIESLSVYENLRLVLSEDNAPLIKMVLSEVELSNIENKIVNTLSGGEKQRVSIARALLKNSNILLCDEPTGSLDQNNTDNIFRILKKLSKKIQIIVVSHDEKSASKYGDRIIRLHDGEVIEDTTLIDSAKEYKSPVNDNQKPHLPIKLLGKISIKYILSRPVISLFMIILTLFSFIFVGLSYSIKDIDSEKKIVQSMMDNQVKNFSFQKKIYCDEDQSYIINLGEDDVLEIKELTNKNIYNIYSFRDNYLTNICTSNGGNLYFNTLSGYAEINRDFINDFRLTLYGELPQNNNEVVITKYLFSAMQTCGIYKSDSLFFPSSEDEVLGEYLEVDYSSYKICGVLDTNFDLSRYSILLKDINNHRLLYEEIKECLKLGIHNVVYFKEGFHKNKMYYCMDDKIDSNTYDLSFSLQSESNFYNTNEYMSSKKLPKEYKVICKEGKDPYNLKNNEILYPLNLKSGKKIYYFMDLGANKFASDNYDLIKEQFSNDNPDKCTVEDYAQFIVSNGYKDDKYNSVSSEELFYLGVEKSAKENPNIFNFDDNFFVNHILYSGLYVKKDVELVGLYYDYNNYDGNTLYCSNSFFEEFKQNTKNYYNDIIYCVCPIDKSKASNLKIYKSILIN